MKIIVGTIIKQANRILIIKEAKKEFFGKWNFPSGNLEKGESIQEGAIRETIEETGCRVELKQVFPIGVDIDRELITIFFLSTLLKEEEILNKDEILEKKWVTIEELKNMKEVDLRYPKEILRILNNIEKEELYPIGILQKI